METLARALLAFMLALGAMALALLLAVRAAKRMAREYLGSFPQRPPVRFAPARTRGALARSRRSAP